MKSVIFIIVLWSTHVAFSQTTNMGFKGKVKFVSNAPLEIIKAESQKITGIIDQTNYNFAFSVTLKSFDGFNSALQQEHFHENYLESLKFPNITYTGKILDKIDWKKDGSYEIRTKGKFNIHGVEKEKILKNKVIIKNGKVSISAVFKIALEDFEITIPRIVHQKIAEEIDIFLELSQKN